jgi:L-ascorbate metabolism protein UlaG (beta-lactamase superfamily)
VHEILLNVFTWISNNMQSIRYLIRKYVRYVVIILFAGLALGVSVGSCAFTAPGYQGPQRSNFDGRVFSNQDAIPEHGFFDLLKWRITRDPEEWVVIEDAVPGTPPSERVDDLRVTFINHSTILIQINGLNILTDPIWSDRTSPVSWAGPKRYRPSGIRYMDLPPIDVVLISHNHYDHLDIPTLKRLSADHHPRMLAGLGNAALLIEHGIDRVVEMAWWHTDELGSGIRANFVPAQHFSGRGIGDRNMTQWGGFVIESPVGAVYFAGDTGWGKHFEQIGRRFPGIRLAMLPIGAYQPEWFMSPVHLNPAEALSAFEELGASHGMGMHFGTFSLADDGQDEPLHDLATAFDRSTVSPETFWILGAGESRDIPPISSIEHVTTVR